MEQLEFFYIADSSFNYFRKLSGSIFKSKTYTYHVILKFPPRYQPKRTECLWAAKEIYKYTYCLQKPHTGKSPNIHQHKVDTKLWSTQTIEYINKDEPTKSINKQR